MCEGNLQTYEHNNPHIDNMEYTLYIRVINGTVLKKYITAKTKATCKAILMVATSRM
jgi:hypothetical protein